MKTGTKIMQLISHVKHKMKKNFHFFLKRIISSQKLKTISLKITVLFKVYYYEIQQFDISYRQI